MIRSLIMVSVLVVMGQAQRPPYAGTANRYPQVLTRFEDERTSTTTTTTATPSTAGIVDRLGDKLATSTSTASPTSSSPTPTRTSTSASTSTSSSPAPISTSTSSDAILYPSENLPVLSLGDTELVDRIKTWPRDKQPWWYINRVAIQQHLNSGTQAGVLRPEGSAKPFFAG